MLATKPLKLRPGRSAAVGVGGRDPATISIVMVLEENNIYRLCAAQAGDIAAYFSWDVLPAM
jgi:hypothetical protein